MTYRHIVITRFCIRTNHGEDGFRVRDLADPQDPLERRSLETRISLFEAICLPSMLSQTEQDFEWIILVDKDLPEAFRIRLEGLVAKRRRSHIQVYDPDCDLMTREWLASYLDPIPDLLMTTNIDDDDGVSARYVACCQEQLIQLTAAKSISDIPPMLVFGALDAMEWDLILSGRAPLGYLSPWHRSLKGGGRYAVACGFSLVTRTDICNFTVYRIPHYESWRLFHAQGPESQSLRALRETFFDCIKRANVALPDPDRSFLDISALAGPVFVSNHFLNVQVIRLYELKPGRLPVTKPADFGCIPVNTTPIESNSHLFQKQMDVYLQSLRRVLVIAGKSTHLQTRRSSMDIIRNALYFTRLFLRA